MSCRGLARVLAAFHRFMDSIYNMKHPAHRRRNVLKSGRARANSIDPEGKLSFPVEGLLSPMFKSKCRYDIRAYNDLFLEIIK